MKRIQMRLFVVHCFITLASGQVLASAYIDTCAKSASDQSEYSKRNTPSPDTPITPYSNTDRSELYDSSPSHNSQSGEKSGFESDGFDLNDSPRKLVKESETWIALKDLDGIKYIFDAKKKRWVQAYSGLIDGMWKPLENGKILTEEEEKKAKDERRMQGIRSPFVEFQKFGGKNFGLDRANKVWIEVDNYSFPLENGKRIPYNQDTLIK